jgi:hypothetical protein
MSTENLESIFTLAEREENESRKQELTDLILSGQSLLVVGAGCSIELGYPTWKELLSELKTLARNCGDDFQEKVKFTDDPLYNVKSIQEYIKEKNGNLDKYYVKLHRLFSPNNRPKQFSQFHTNMVGLPFKGIITTNYDIVLDKALADISPGDYTNKKPLVVEELPVSEFFLSLDSNQHPKQVIHLHGYFEEPKNIILSTSEYERAYGFKPVREEEGNRFWSLHRKLLWAILATRRSVWIGFSMTDRYLRYMLNIVNSDLWRWGAPFHYAIMGIKDEKADSSKNLAKSLKEDYDIEVVFYEYNDHDHSALNKIISEIYEKFRNKQTRKEADERDVESKKIHQTKINDDQKPKKDSSDWLDSINRKFEKGPI